MNTNSTGNVPADRGFEWKVGKQSGEEKRGTGW